MPQKFISHLKKYFIDIDLSKRRTIMISAMGRSGTTWLAELINYNKKYRDVFEPFYPYKVDTAKKFKYLQYLNPENNNTELRRSAEQILSGKFRNEWSDINNTRLFYNKRIIKDIRTNLMLAWLKRIRPDMPLILLIRSPYSVIDSYKELGWGMEAGGTKSDFERIVGQKELLSDFPIINDIYESIDSQDYVTRLIFQWCVLYYVPLEQLSKDDFMLVYYENLLLYPKEILSKIFNYLEINIDISAVLNNIKNPSNTNYRKVDFNTDKTHLIEKWKRSLSKSDLKKIDDVIKLFKIDTFYDTNGYPIQSGG